MSCNNYTATQIPVSVGFDADGNAGSLVETKEIKVTKIETPTDADQLIIAAGTEVVFEGDVVVQGYLYGVAAEGASSLSSLTDVTITSVADGEVLVWSSNDWINRTLSEAGILGTTDLANYATNTYVSSNYATSNSLSAYAPSSWVNSNFVYGSSVGFTGAGGVQAYDIALQAISQVTPAADRLPYFTGGSTAATATLTSFARTNLLNAIDATTVITNIGAVPSNQNLQDIIDIGTPGLGNDTYVIAWDEGLSQFTLQAQTGGGASVLNDLNDVTAPSPGNNDFLVYDTGTTDWVNKTPAQARTSIGATTVGNNIITLTNPGALTYLRLNADNSVSARTYVQVKQDLDLEVNSDIQAYDAGLQSIANLNPGANTLVYFSATDEAASSPLTQFGRSLLDDANATECRGTLSAQLSSVPLGNLTDLCTGTGSTGASAFGRLLYTVPSDLSPTINILPVPLFDPTTIANNFGKVLSLRSFAGGTLAQPQFQFLYFGELGNVNLGGGAGQGGELTPGRILYVDGSKNLTELANPGSDSFLKHNGTTPSWRSAADVRTDIGAQASDPTLTALAGVTTAANTIIYFTGADSATSTGLTAAGRKIIACPDTLAAGDIFYYDGTDFRKLAKPAKGGVLVKDTTSDNPKWVEAPSTDGSYNFRATVSDTGGTVSFSFVGI